MGPGYELLCVSDSLEFAHTRYVRMHVMTVARGNAAGCVESNKDERFK